MLQEADDDRDVGVALLIRLQDRRQQVVQWGQALLLREDAGHNQLGKFNPRRKKQIVSINSLHKLGKVCGYTI